MSDYNNVPRLPIYMIGGNAELMKSMHDEAKEDATNFRVTDDLPGMETIHATYRSPLGRENGNVMFRRYPDNALDYDYAVAWVVDAIHKAKDKVPLTNQEELALSVVFPSAFNFMDPDVAAAMARVNMRLLPDEIQMISFKVMAHLKEEMNWNGGAGGGSVPGRSSTRA